MLLCRMQVLFTQSWINLRHGSLSSMENSQWVKNPWHGSVLAMDHHQTWISDKDGSLSVMDHCQEGFSLRHGSLRYGSVLFIDHLQCWFSHGSLSNRLILGIDYSLTDYSILGMDHYQACIIFGMDHCRSIICMDHSQIWTNPGHWPVLNMAQYQA